MLLLMLIIGTHAFTYISVQHWLQHAQDNQGPLSMRV